MSIFQFIEFMITNLVPQNLIKLFMAKKSKVIIRGRDARTGQFIPLKEAERRPATTVIETFKKKKK